MPNWGIKAIYTFLVLGDKAQLAKAPVIWLGKHITRRVPLTWMHRISAAVFAVLGLLAILSA